ncbi:GNAT family N-acetyltransferase [Ornithinimicrobium sp. LYQ121]|uniref:GNAT family N-acetyltransferase n=1 Tax=Ornithinimicrobium sp. LYQ121 TaxID=3378801 RepID=UPI003852C320
MLLNPKSVALGPTKTSRRLNALEVTGKDSQAATIAYSTLGQIFGTEYGRRSKGTDKGGNGLVRRRYFLFLDASNEPVGTASLHALGNTLAVHDVGIVDVHRGMGYGRELMGWLLGQCQRDMRVYLQCEKGWHTEFYESCGFELIHERTGYERLET